MNEQKSPALKYHELHRGKLQVTPIMDLQTKEDLNLAYTPGVAEPCLEIVKDKAMAYNYTLKGRVVAIVTDGSAVLGLGNISALPALPVMEGKAALLYKFSGIEAFPICLDTQDPDKIIETVINIAPTFGAIMLEDISAPNCVRIERELQDKLDIPIFHDDQHGTAIVVSAAMLNVARLTKKHLDELKVVVSGTGAAGSNVIRMLNLLGIKSVYAYNIHGIVSRKDYDKYDFVVKELLDANYISDPEGNIISLEDLMKGKDVFIGLSAPNLLNEKMVKGMNPNPIIFALANPIPEIMPQLARKAGATIIGTGRSDYPNQINNVLVFPGLMKGALQAKAKSITLEMKLAAAYCLADLIKDEELSPEYILPSVFDERVCDSIAAACYKAATKKPSRKKA
ncbi:MAG: NADP-dependent malic enzyme [Bacilli bacterium]|nr:NADP-dependent malic enzyme [Bacilli bacterium]